MSEKETKKAPKSTLGKLPVEIKRFIGKEVEYKTNGVLYEKGILENIDEHGFLFSNGEEMDFVSHSAGLKIKIGRKLELAKALYPKTDFAKDYFLKIDEEGQI